MISCLGESASARVRLDKALVAGFALIEIEQGDQRCTDEWNDNAEDPEAPSPSHPSKDAFYSVPIDPSSDHPW